MDALKALASQQACSADGTAVSRNPMSNFVSQVGKDGSTVNFGPRGGQQQFAHRQSNEIEQAMAAGMGQAVGPQVRAPGMMNPDMLVNEFTRMQHQKPQNSNWVNQFDNMHLSPQQQQQQQHHQQFGVQQPRHLSQNFGQVPTQMGQRWVSQLNSQPRGPIMMDQAWQQRSNQVSNLSQTWSNQLHNTVRPVGQNFVSEAKQTMSSVKQQQQEQQQQPKAKEFSGAQSEVDELRKATQQLVDVMSSSDKFQESEFYKSMSEIANGEAVIQDNEIKPLNTQTEAPNLSQAFAEVESMMQNSEFDEEKIKSLFEKAYTEQVNGSGGNIEAELENYFNSGFNYGDMNQNNFEITEEPKLYELQSDNKFAEDLSKSESELFELGLRLFNKGELQQASLAFEAVLQKDATNSEAWRLLGTIHQESDEDVKAIQCLQNSVEQDPYNLKALLGLGVSFVNELRPNEALNTLRNWIRHNPNFSTLESELSNDIYFDSETSANSSERVMQEVMLLMTKAQQHAPKDADVHEVLGVLFNVTRDYNSAAKAFQTALTQRVDDYSLWNKLGATLANSSNSAEALKHYSRALELKPKYARGWLNYGISYSNLGEYQNAIRAYLRALELNPKATHVWNYVRICLSCIDGYEFLMPEVERRNIDAFRKAFNF